jgi:hypothetical protein
VLTGRFWPDCLAKDFHLTAVFDYDPAVYIWFIDSNISSSFAPNVDLLVKDVALSSRVSFTKLDEGGSNRML